MTASRNSKKPELMTIKPQASHDEIKKNLIASSERKGIKVKPSKKA